MGDGENISVAVPFRNK